MILILARGRKYFELQKFYLVFNLNLIRLMLKMESLWILIEILLFIYIVIIILGRRARWGLCLLPERTETGGRRG